MNAYYGPFPENPGVSEDYFSFSGTHMTEHVSPRTRGLTTPRRGDIIVYTCTDIILFYFFVIDN